MWDNLCAIGALLLDFFMYLLMCICVIVMIGASLALMLWVTFTICGWLGMNTNG